MTKDELQKALDDEKKAHAETRRRHQELMTNEVKKHEEEIRVKQRLTRILHIIRDLINHEIGSSMSKLTTWAVLGMGAIAAYLIGTGRLG